MSLPPSVNEITGEDPTTAELSPCLSASFVRDLSRGPLAPFIRSRSDMRNSRPAPAR